MKEEKGEVLDFLVGIKPFDNLMFSLKTTFKPLGS